MAIAVERAANPTVTDFSTRQARRRLPRTGVVALAVLALLAVVSAQVRTLLHEAVRRDDTPSPAG